MSPRACHSQNQNNQRKLGPEFWRFVSLKDVELDRLTSKEAMLFPTVQRFQQSGDLTRGAGLGKVITLPSGPHSHYIRVHFLKWRATHEGKATPLSSCASLPRAANFQAI